MLILIMAAAAATTGGPDAAIGRWKTETRNGIVEIERCGASVCGRLVTSDGIRDNPNLTDANNRDAALRTRPLRNLTILSGFTRTAASWDGGTIYNAGDGKTYNARLTPEGADRLKVRGCLFVPLCRTQMWTRMR